MKIFLVLFLLAFFLSLTIFLAGGRNAQTIQVDPSNQWEYISNEVIVKFKQGTERATIQYGINAVQGRIKTYLGNEISTHEWDAQAATLRSFLADPYLLLIKVPESVGVDQAIYDLSLNPNVEYAEKNYIGRFLSTIPNDTHFSKLWGLRNTGQTYGTVDADIDAPEAWDICTGSSSVVVAVIDSGINYNHDDLQANIWINQGEIGGGKMTNDIDDDGNGYIDDWHGWNFYNGTNNPMDTYEPLFHGTHVAGTIGAKGDNGNGVTGLCWTVKLMALKAFDTAQFVNAIDYATDNGAYISNNSWDVPNSGSLEDAINRARTNGRLFVCAAANDNKNIDNSPVYPACYDLDNIISVLATDHNDQRSPYSNWGAYSVDVGAPGGTDFYPDQGIRNIYSTKNDNGYQYMSGTSMASPQVAGLVALIKAHHPGWNWWQVKTILMNSVDTKGSLSGKCLTQGRINAYNALIASTPNLPAAPSNLNAQAFGCDVRLTWTDNSNNESGFYIYRKNGNIYVQMGYTGPNETTFWDYELPSGTYSYYVRAYNTDGTSLKCPVKSIKLTGC
jgi:subtilisin family serine protease